MVRHHLWLPGSFWDSRFPHILLEADARSSIPFGQSKRVHKEQEETQPRVPVLRYRPKYK